MSDRGIWRTLVWSLAAIVVALASHVNAQQVTRIDERAVRDLLEVMAQANRRRDAALVCRRLHDKATITIMGTRSGSRQEMSKAEYCEFLKNGYAATPPGMRYDSVYRLRSMDVAPDGRSARIDAELEEVVDIGSGSMSLVSQHSTRLQVVSGRLMVTDVTARLPH